MTGSLYRAASCSKWRRDSGTPSVGGFTTMSGLGWLRLAWLHMIGTEPRNCTTDATRPRPCSPASARHTTCSVSTSLATSPSALTPRRRYRVPAKWRDRRDTRVMSTRAERCRWRDFCLKKPWMMGSTQWVWVGVGLAPPPTCRSMCCSRYTFHTKRFWHSTTPSRGSSAASAHSTTSGEASRVMQVAAHAHVLRSHAATATTTATATATATVQPCAEATTPPASKCAHLQSLAPTRGAAGWLATTVTGRMCRRRRNCGGGRHSSATARTWEEHAAAAPHNPRHASVRR